MFHHVPKCDFYVHPMRFVFHLFLYSFPLKSSGLLESLNSLIILINS